MFKCTKWKQKIPAFAGMTEFNGGYHRADALYFFLPVRSGVDRADGHGPEALGQFQPLRKKMVYGAYGKRTFADCGNAASRSEAAAGAGTSRPDGAFAVAGRWARVSD